MLSEGTKQVAVRRRRDKERKVFPRKYFLFYNRLGEPDFRQQPCKPCGTHNVRYEEEACEHEQIAYNISK